MMCGGREWTGVGKEEGNGAEKSVVFIFQYFTRRINVGTKGIAVTE
jgi:hypothetical protein